MARTPTKKPKKKKARKGKVVVPSLAPAAFEDAVKAFLAVKPKKGE